MKKQAKGPKFRVGQVVAVHIGNVDFYEQVRRVNKRSVAIGTNAIAYPNDSLRPLCVRLAQREGGNAPPEGAKVFANPGYSRKEEAADLCIEWHRRGHFVVMLVPVETSTQFAKKLFQYGVERMYFDRRIFPNCRGVELLILTGGSDEGQQGRVQVAQAKKFGMTWRKRKCGA